MNPFNKNNKLVNSNNSVRPNIKLNLADIFQDALNNSKQENISVNINLENQKLTKNSNVTDLNNLDNKYANSICYRNNNIHFSSSNTNAQENTSNLRERPRIKIASKCLNKLYNKSSLIINEAPVGDEIGYGSPKINIDVNADAYKLLSNIVIVTPKKHSVLNEGEKINNLNCNVQNITENISHNTLNSKTNNNCETEPAIYSKADNCSIESNEGTDIKINTRKKTKSNTKKQKGKKNINLMIKISMN